MKARENAMSRGEREKDAQKLATMLRVLPPTLKPVNNLICCKRGLIWVVQRATSLSTQDTVTHALFSCTHLSRADIRVCPPGPSWQTFDRKGKRGMKAREDAIGRGTRGNGAQ